MKVRSALVLGIILLFGTAAFAQDYPKAEVGLNYVFMRFNPENSSYVSGFSLNGGGGDLTYNLTHSFGIKAEFVGTTSQTRTFNIPTGIACPGGGCQFNAQGNLFTYNALVVYKIRAPKVEPYVEVGFGGAHSNVYANVKTACIGCVFAKAPSNNAFDFIIGGGIEIPVTKSVAIRPAQFDFVLTRFGNGFTSGNTNQSNFRYTGGIVFRF